MNELGGEITRLSYEDVEEDVKKAQEMAKDKDNQSNDRLNDEK